ncbi:MAG TPA: GAF domain-containing protein [Chthonomonadales bacterium]|nr:GAF domain-containing protein [Chthonomonadales bacterium]
MSKREAYAAALERIERLIEGETDEVAILATVVCELHHALAHFHWTGFYRVTEPGMLRVGPYQGGHGCLAIPFERGVCGAAARERQTQLVPDVALAPHHIACSSTTRSEIVVPVLDREGAVRAVLDVDSDELAAFDDEDRAWLERLCARVGRTVLWPRLPAARPGAP